MIIVTLGASYAQTTSDWWQPVPRTTWQIQLQGEINTAYAVEVYVLDLFDTPQAIIDELHAVGRKVICYFSAGTYEKWREDADLFSSKILGETVAGWEEERWLDIRRQSLVQPIMMSRLDLAAQKGCDGVDPDNVDAYTNVTGFPLTYEDQLAYNLWLADEAHQRGLAVGLKNDLDQLEELVEHFDWALNEQCFAYDECDLLLPFIEAGKAVFTIEYEENRADYCPLANALGFSTLTKTPDLDDEPPNACAEYES